jgi:hypothetical protein
MPLPAEDTYTFQIVGVHYDEKRNLYIIYLWLDGLEDDAGEPQRATIFGVKGCKKMMFTKPDGESVWSGLYTLLMRLGFKPHNFSGHESVNMLKLIGTKGKAFFKHSRCADCQQLEERVQDCTAKGCGEFLNTYYKNLVDLVETEEQELFNHNQKLGDGLLTPSKPVKYNRRNNNTPPTPRSFD